MIMHMVRQTRSDKGKRRGPHKGTPHKMPRTKRPLPPHAFPDLPDELRRLFSIRSSLQPVIDMALYTWSRMGTRKRAGTRLP